MANRELTRPRGSASGDVDLDHATLNLPDVTVTTEHFSDITSANTQIAVGSSLAVCYEAGTSKWWHVA